MSPAMSLTRVRSISTASPLKEFLSQHTICTAHECRDERVYNAAQIKILVQRHVFEKAIERGVNKHALLCPQSGEYFNAQYQHAPETPTIINVQMMLVTRIMPRPYRRCKVTTRCLVRRTPFFAYRNTIYGRYIDGIAITML